MSNPTSNFGWQMPTATDLVTDLPADFEVFGQAVDTDFADLNGGTTGQILSKTTSADLDFTWINNDQGDITGVTAGTGISGGGTSGTVTVTNSMATAIDAKGDLIAGTGADAFSRLGVGANDTVLTADSGEATGLKWATPTAAPIQTATFADEKAQSTDGGTFTSGAWRTRTLNTTRNNSITGASLSSNQITLAAGTYLINANAVANSCSRNQARLQNITDSTTTLIGSNQYNENAGSVQANSTVLGSFTIAGTKVFELQHQAQTTVTGVGFGYPTNFSTEVYAQITIIKVA